MVKNEKGFTIVELLAMIVISSIIITPLMFSLISNVNTNHLLHTRRSSVSIADGAIYGFDKLSYTDLEDKLGLAAANYLEFDNLSCNQLDASDDVAVCEIIFGSEFSSVSFDEEHFKVFVYDYNISAGQQSLWTSEATSPFPEDVRNEIALLTPSTDPNPGLLRIAVWINYSDDPDYSIVVSGLLIGDWTDSIYE